MFSLLKKHRWYSKTLLFRWYLIFTWDRTKLKVVLANCSILQRLKEKNSTGIFKIIELWLFNCFEWFVKQYQLDDFLYIKANMKTEYRIKLHSYAVTFFFKLFGYSWCFRYVSPIIKHIQRLKKLALQKCKTLCLHVFSKIALCNITFKSLFDSKISLFALFYHFL